MKFAIETVEMKGHCSAEKTMRESREKNSVGRKYFIVREGNELLDGVQPILLAVDHWTVSLCFEYPHLIKPPTAVFPITCHTCVAV
jgi:hypothetical protein